MAEALALVRSDLGADAVILHTRTYKRGGFLGIGAQNVVEITAGAGRDIGRQRRLAADRDRVKRLQATALSVSRGAHASSGEPATATAVAQPAMAGDLIRRTYAAAKAEFERAQPPEPRVTIAPPPPQDGSQLASEMQAVKRLVAQMMRQQRERNTAIKPELPDKLVDQYLALLQQEVADELADEIVEEVRGKVDAGGLADESACRQAVCGAVASLLPSDPPAGAPGRGRDGRPRVVALVGPTGVGKTTTVAKLAATFKLKQGKRVGLITIDTYRIAAVDQLRTYAGIIGLPLHVVLAPDEMRQALEKCADCDVVLIDTAGRSQRDGHRLDELSRFIDAADPDEVHLVLSSTCSQAVLMQAVERFSQVRTDSIIFTKLDEAVSFGVLLNVLRKVNKKLSYITTGQEVPHQIEPGDPARLAALVMGECVV